MLLLYATLRSRLYQKLDQWNFNSASRDATGGTNGNPQKQTERRASAGNLQPNLHNAVYYNQRQHGALNETGAVCSCGSYHAPSL